MSQQSTVDSLLSVLPMRLRHLAARAAGRRPWIMPPAAAANSYLAPGNQWYTPAVGGASSFVPSTVGGRVVREALQVLGHLSGDAYLAFVRDFYETGLERFGDNWCYADINTVLLGLAHVLRPASYLEIGVRRGRSLAMLTSKAPSCRIVACDLFIERYAGMENPGADWVRGELERLGFSGSLDFVVGDSAKVLPRYFAEHPEAYFDIITVDGDHTARGARADLTNVITRLKIGGALVFDDISNPSHPTLRGLWHDMIVSDGRFSTYTFDEVGFGVGFAIRKS